MPDYGEGINIYKQSLYELLKDDPLYEITLTSKRKAFKKSKSDSPVGKKKKPKLTKSIKWKTKSKSLKKKNKVKRNVKA